MDLIINSLFVRIGKYSSLGTITLENARFACCSLSYIVNRTDTDNITMTKGIIFNLFWKFYFYHKFAFSCLLLFELCHTILVYIKRCVVMLSCRLLSDTINVINNSYKMFWESQSCIRRRTKALDGKSRSLESSNEAWSELFVLMLLI